MRLRFAPSPTGFMHVGNARSAVLNWAYAKKNKGEFILRIDDTDKIRSKKDYEKNIKENLRWLGLDWDKTFNQSSKYENYEINILKLKESGRIYPCFETEEELSLKRKSLLSSGKPPIYDRSSLKLTKKDIEKNLNEGKKPHWRFKLVDEIISWQDLIKGKVSFDSKNLSDPILIREDGSLLYHLPSVIDDIDEKITNIIRGEDHISNTAFHIQLFKSLNASVPKFAHHPFLTDSEGKGFGKRLGSLSINKLQDLGYEYITILNYLLNIGSNQDIIADKNISSLINNFDLKNISSSNPKFSIDVLKSLNKDILQSYVFDEISDRINLICEDLIDKKLWQFTKNNIDFFVEIKNWVDIIKSENNFMKDTMDAKLINAAIESLPEDPYNEDSWDIWTSKIKDLTSLKGKDLFMPLRKILTGMNNGPELKYLLPLLNKKVILKKFGKL
tara:strand:- start:1218 stop:2552 length:1335 start_codon:yes stop_codon:yes gene_type:complete